MERIVNKGIKVDLHIHSKKSAFKDKEIVKDSTINNVSILINKLIENEINMCAITDHDCFDYDLYMKLKEEESKDNLIQKILPGVEFTVSFTRNQITKPLHVIAIFDDSDSTKIKNIEQILRLVNNRPQYDLGNIYSEQRFLNILSEINLNVILIVHQKQTISSSSKPKQNDANSFGEEVFNDFVLSEYFEAFEFKNMKNEVFNNLEKQKYANDALRFITGSDCHEWAYYPKHDAKSKDDFFQFTYLKCLPTFRGLTFALTDESRISYLDNFFTTNINNYINSIDLCIHNIDYSIPLSKGINVIIGDNSIGKSLLLHKLTDFYRQTVDNSLSPLSSSLVKHYKQYLDEKQIKIHTVLTQDKIFGFDTQGEIRRKFNQKKLTNKSFFEDKYPPDVDVTESKNKVQSQIDIVLDSITKKFSYDELYDSLGKVSLLKNEVNPSSLSLLDCDLSSLNEKQKKIHAIASTYEKVLPFLNALLGMEVSEKEKDKIKEFVSYIEKQKNEYTKKKTIIFKNIKLINSINSSFKFFDNERQNINSDNDNLYSNYVHSVENFSLQIVNLLKRKNSINDYSVNIDEEYLKPNERPYLNYTFIKKTQIEKIDNVYLNNLIIKPLKKNKTLLPIHTLKKSEFIEFLSKYDDEEFPNPVDYYKHRLDDEIQKDFKIIPTIINSKDDVRSEYSDGVNSHVYFDIISSNIYQKGIYLIDQPEDDVSPHSIKKYLLQDFKHMGKDRQIIIVTHNPQFVVNLDVDNVICLTKDVDEQIQIINGALEYKDGKVDIIKTVADSLEGGIDSLKKRLKRYEKNND